MANGHRAAEPAPARTGAARGGLAFGRLLCAGAATGSLAAAVLHVSAALDHRDLPWQAGAFWATAVFQAGWSLVACRRAPAAGSRAGVLWAGVAANAAFVAAWFFSRTSGLGFMPGSGHESAEPVGVKDATTVLLEGALIGTLCLYLFLPEVGRRRVLPEGRLLLGGSAGVAGLAVVLAFVGPPPGEAGHGHGEGALSAGHGHAPGAAGAADGHGGEPDASHPHTEPGRDGVVHAEADHGDGATGGSAHNGTAHSGSAHNGTAHDEGDHGHGGAVLRSAAGSGHAHEAAGPHAHGSGAARAHSPAAGDHVHDPSVPHEHDPSAAHEAHAAEPGHAHAPESTAGGHQHDDPQAGHPQEHGEHAPSDQEHSDQEHSDHEHGDSPPPGVLEGLLERLGVSDPRP